jgi:methylase of polypeptide subunit release factors
MQLNDVERLFSGLIGAEYEMLKLICPAAAEMSEKVGRFVSTWKPAELARPLQAFEIGCGTGLTTLALLDARDDVVIKAVDNEPSMLDQARKNLARWVEQGRLQLIEADALAGLKERRSRRVELRLS